MRWQVIWSFAKKGCELEDAASCDLLSVFYETGIGTTKDPGKAAKYRRKAGELDSRYK